MTAVVADLLRAAVDLGVTPGEVKGSEDVRFAVQVAAGLPDVRIRSEQWRDVLPRLADAHEAAARPSRGRVAHCKACSAPIVWGETEAARPMSIDPLPRPDGNVIRVPQGKRLVLRVIPPAALPVVGRPAYFAHFVTCPFADQFRRSKPARDRLRGADGKVSKCPACRLPMDPWLPANGYTTHPTCDSPDPRRA